MPTTSRAGLRYPTDTNAPNIPQDIQNLANDVDALISPGQVTALFSNGNLNVSGWPTMAASSTTNPLFTQSITASVKARGHVHFVLGIKTTTSGTQTGSVTVTVGDTNYVQSFTVFSSATTSVPIALMTNIPSGTSTFVVAVSLNAGPSCATDYAGLRITI